MSPDPAARLISGSIVPLNLLGFGPDLLGRISPWYCIGGSTEACGKTMTDDSGLADPRGVLLTFLNRRPRARVSQQESRAPSRRVSSA